MADTAASSPKGRIKIDIPAGAKVSDSLDAIGVAQAKADALCKANPNMKEVIANAPLGKDTLKYSTPCPSKGASAPHK